MRHVTPGERPQNDAGYLEMMTKIIFMGGLNRQVVENKWNGFLDAFHGFDPGKVANFTQEDVERLSEDERIIRYGAKIRAVVDNASRMLTLADENGSFGKWLRRNVQQEGIDDTAEMLANQFAYLSETSAKNFLYAVGEEVDEITEEARQKYGSG
jgi:DNA-3-methyladenine glycosylase I